MAVVRSESQQMKAKRPLRVHRVKEFHSTWVMIEVTPGSTR